MIDDSLSDSRWIEEVLGRYEQPLIRRALRITGDLETARDVVQDTFVKLCKMERDQIHGNLAAWLFTVCRNRALDIIKKEGRMGPLKDANALPELRSGPGQEALNREAVDIIKDVLSTVSDPQKEAFLLKFEDQMTYREISEVMGKSLGTVSKLITATILAMRQRMERGPKPAGGME